MTQTESDIGGLREPVKQSGGATALVTLEGIEAELSSLNAQVDGLRGQLQAHTARKVTQVKVEDIDMPFLAMVGFLIKLSLASIPATIIMFILFAVLTAIVAAFTGIAWLGLTG